VGARALALWFSVAIAMAGCAANSIENFKGKNSDEAQIAGLIRRIPDGIKARSLNVVMLPYTEDVYIGNFTSTWALPP